jgi:hypothetical protein
MYLIGVIESLAVLMLLSPNLPHIGAFLGFGTMIGAAIAHVTVLGLGPGDGIMVGMLGAVVLLTVGIMFIRRRDMPLIRHTYDDR